MAPGKNIKKGPFAKPPAPTQPTGQKRPGTSGALPPGSPKKPPTTATGRI